MKVQSSRFGTVEVGEAAEIRFARGLIGFPRETSFVLLRREGAAHVGWLQSTTTAELAFPVVSVDGLDVVYPDVGIEEIFAVSGLTGSPEALAVMAVITATATGSTATVNLLSPIIVNAETRTGAQVVLEHSRFTTQEPFRMHRKGAPAPQPLHAAPLSP
jgi:flagellar assembly factor FliW